MKKIIFIELLHHHECIENPYLIYKKQGYETRAILGEFVFKKLKNINQYNDEFHVLNQPIRTQFNFLSFVGKILYFFREFFEISKNIKEIRSIVKNEKPDILYINTIESPFLILLMIYLLRLKDMKLHLVIHNTNRLKVGFIKYFLFDFLIQKLIQKSERIILLGEYLKFDDEDIQKKVMYINNRIPQKIINRKKFEKLTFVMSGSLNYKQKDIETVLKGFSDFLLKNKKYEDNIQLVLLGQINPTVEKWIKTYNLTGIVKTFDHYVGEEDMNKYMGGAHYAIISVYKNSIYGKYKISGAYGDAVAFSVPILLSQYYAPEYKSSSVYRFNKQTLAQLLQDIIHKNRVNEQLLK